MQLQPLCSNLFCLPLAASSLLAHAAGNTFWTSLPNRRDSFCAELVHQMLARLTALVTRDVQTCFNFVEVSLNSQYSPA